MGASATGRGLVRRRRRRWVRGGGLAVALVVLAAGGAGWAVYAKLDGNITSDSATAAELARYEKERPSALVKGAQNILVIGSDTRSGKDNRRYGRDSGTERSDTVILLHLAAGRGSATAMSIPRDLMVDVPSCARPGQGRSEPMFAMFNHAFEMGGPACTIRTVERLTDIRIDHHVVVDFRGFKDVVDAVDGVEVCLTEPVRDKAAKLSLPAGRVTLDGEQALGYVRARKSLGNGSDTDRMARQQRFLGALVNKVRGTDVLLNPVKLYPVLDAATSSLTTDPGLASLRALYELARGLRDIPTERVQFLTVPRESYTQNANRDQLVEPEASRLFAHLRADKPVEVATRTPPDTSAKSNGATADSEESGESPHGGPGVDSSAQSDDHGEYNSEPDSEPTSEYDYRRVFQDGYEIWKDGRLRPAEPVSADSPAPTFPGNTAAEDGCE